MIDNNPPFGVRHIVRWSERSLAPRHYWGDRYEDALYERVDGFLSGVIVGAAIALGLIALALLIAVTAVG